MNSNRDLHISFRSRGSQLTVSSSCLQKKPRAFPSALLDRLILIWAHQLSCGSSSVPQHGGEGERVTGHGVKVNKWPTLIPGNVILCRTWQLHFPSFTNWVAEMDAGRMENARNSVFSVVLCGGLVCQWGLCWSDRLKEAVVSPHSFSCPWCYCLWVCILMRFLSEVYIESK